MAEYAKLAGKAMAGATILSFDQNAEAIEGEWHGTQTVLLEFESVEAAREWYNSDAYQEGGQASAGGRRLQRRHPHRAGIGHFQARADAKTPISSRNWGFSRLLGGS